MNRFTDNQDGTIFDSHTNLLWLKDANHFKTSMTWKEAIKACAALGDGWRLPERFELVHLLNPIKVSPPIPKGHLFSNVQSFYYWSATIYADGTNYMWVVFVYDGYVSSGNKTYGSYYVWPVRG